MPVYTTINGRQHKIPMLSPQDVEEMTDLAFQDRMDSALRLVGDPKMPVPLRSKYLQDVEAMKNSTWLFAQFCDTFRGIRQVFQRTFARAEPPLDPATDLDGLSISDQMVLAHRIARISVVDTEPKKKDGPESDPTKGASSGPTT